MIDPIPAAMVSTNASNANVPNSCRAHCASFGLVAALAADASRAGGDDSLGITAICNGSATVT